MILFGRTICKSWFCLVGWYVKLWFGLGERYVKLWFGLWERYVNYDIVWEIM